MKRPVFFRVKTGNNEVSFYQGKYSRCVLRMADHWAVQSRDEAKLIGQAKFDSAKEALSYARFDRQPVELGQSVDKNRRDIANWLWNGIASGSVDALQDYIDRCIARNLRPNLSAFSEANAEHR